jgi:hypothetical protein
MDLPGSGRATMIALLTDGHQVALMGENQAHELAFMPPERDECGGFVLVAGDGGDRFGDWA